MNTKIEHLNAINQWRKQHISNQNFKKNRFRFACIQKKLIIHLPQAEMGLKFTPNNSSQPAEILHQTYGRTHFKNPQNFEK